MMADINMKLYLVEYLGFTAMDKRFSRPMLPWIIAEIKRRGSSEKVCLGINDGAVHAFNFTCEPDTPIFTHSLQNILRFSHAYSDQCTFMYLLRDPNEPLLYCYLFQATDPKHVTELFNAMREQSREEVPAVTPGPGGGRSYSSAAALTSLSADISPSSSHFFEVLYIGKIKVSHKKVPESFIDDALEKFRVHELEKEKVKVCKTVSHANGTGSGPIHVEPVHSGPCANIISMEDRGRRGSQDSNCSNELGSTENMTVTSPSLLSPGTLESPPTLVATNKLGGSVETLAASDIPQPEIPSESIPQNTTEESSWIKQTSVKLEPMRDRAASTGSARELRKSESVTHGHGHGQSRVMLFQVGRTDLHLISPDRKQILLHKQLRDVASCIQGIKNADHFGFICREANVECYIGYVFKCQSESVSDDVVGAITQAFLATSEAQRREKMPVLSCEHCPMVWYHKLCTDAEGLNEKKTQMIIFKRLELLPEEEQSTILTKFRGAETSSVREQNEFLMMLLRAHCESKQVRHVHDTAENRHEFLNQYLGGGTIFMKAKRSLTSSFDQLLKRKGSRDDFGPIIKEMSLPMNAALCKDSPGQQSPTASTPTIELPEGTDTSGSQVIRPRAFTVGSVSSEGSRQSSLSPGSSQQHLAGGISPHAQKTRPMMNIFLKVGNSPKVSPPHEPNQDVTRQTGSWRQAIFNRVVTPNKTRPDGVVNSHSDENDHCKRDQSELRALWKKAINQQLLLIRMEKENARLRARQEEATVKRIKLEYDEIGSCRREVTEVWDLLVSKESRLSIRCDSQMLLQAIRQGVPRSKRGDVWQFLAEQHCLKMAPIDSSGFPNYHTPYETLLKQLTSHQHSILVDLGRTFPGHTYFSSPLGPGQLALFNLLKAYSLLDPEVGYCQGLNFVAGILLLHMSEDSAFSLLRHLMFRRGLRRQFLPDMAALQVQLYQLSRLLHDQFPDLYAHFETHEIAPTLYAAPWILTIFASQFPLGFVTRVFDLLFLESPEVIFRVAMALLGEHHEQLLACDSFEEIMNYLKNQIPNIDRTTLDRIMKQVFLLDITKQLHEYEVEYHVLQEELISCRPETEALAAQNQLLTQQLEIASSNIQRLETSRTTQQATINRLESHVRSLEVSIAAMGSFISTLAESKVDVEIPGEVRRILAQLSVAERRRSSACASQGLIKSSVSDSSILKGVPLRVIENQDLYSQNRISSLKSVSNGSEVALGNSKSIRGVDRGTPFPLKATLSSPNLSARLTGMSSFFANSHNQLKQHRLNAANALSNSSTNFLDPKKASTILVGNNNDITHSTTCDALPKNGNLSSNIVHSSIVENSLNDCYDKSNSLPLGGSRSKLTTSQSSFELTSNKTNSAESGDSGNVTPTSPSNHIHPLDTCLGVNFSYGGTTKLKTIRPLRAQLSRNASVESLNILKPGPGGDASNSNTIDLTVHSEPQTLSAISQSKTTLLTR